VLGLVNQLSRKPDAPGAGVNAEKQKPDMQTPAVARGGALGGRRPSRT
jgi:hypothetical protein